MQKPWFQNYSAVGRSLELTAFVVSIPILFLFWALSVKRMKGHVACLLGIAFVANYSGMSFTLALALSYSTGKLFPFFSPIIGWLGVFLTGSVTSSAALFGKLQQVTAAQIGINPVLTTSANLAGGVARKLISPQSLTIACVATGMIGREAAVTGAEWEEIEAGKVVLGFDMVLWLARLLNLGRSWRPYLAKLCAGALGL